MTLTATFELTPRNPRYFVSNSNYAKIYVYGAYFVPTVVPASWYSFEGQYTADLLHFNASFSADPALDYSVFSNRRLAPHIELQYDLGALGVNKELALVFGFTATSFSRLLVFTNAGLLGEERLYLGDNQFLMEVESLDLITLYFIHVHLEGENDGGNWFFKGISGYVV